MKKSMLRNILIILAIVIFSGVMVIAITTHGRTAPRPALAEQAADVSPESSLSETIHLEQKSKNNNLENKITQGQKKRKKKFKRGKRKIKHNRVTRRKIQTKIRMIKIITIQIKTITMRITGASRINRKAPMNIQIYQRMHM